MDISAVIVSYNSAPFLKDNLRSLLEQSTGFKEIIVVDNHSTDGSRKILENQPGIRLLPMDFNSGYAAAANMGIRLCTSPLILVANADTILDVEFNVNVIRAFEKDSSIALLSPLLLRFDRITVDSAGQELSRALYPREIGYNRSRADLELQEGPVFSVCGAATVFCRSALKILEIDGQYYDEDFFAFWEDLDIGWRAQLLGLNTYFYPEAVVYHYRSGTLKRTLLSRYSLALSRSGEIKYHLVKNRYLTLIKNFRLKTDWRSFPFILVKDLVWVTLLTISSPKIIMKLLRSGRYFSGGLTKRRIIKGKEKRKRRHD